METLIKTWWDDVDATLSTDTVVDYSTISLLLSGKHYSLLTIIMISMLATARVMLNTLIYI